MNQRLVGMTVIASTVLISPMMIATAAGQSQRAGANAVPAGIGAVGEAELPVRRIVLYRSGVGYFERQGSVQGEQSAQLRFETGQINDILKSMVLLDLDGGRINAVTYNSKEPLARRLASFGVDISGAPGFAALFQQLRGSRITVQSPDGEIGGTILGVEKRTVSPALRTGGGPEHGQPFMDDFVNLVTTSGVRSVRINDILSFKFADPELAEELNKALAALAEQRAENVKSVDLSFSGEAGRDRRIVVAYIHEMPVWKTSYRLVLPDAPAKPAEGSPDKQTITLQGWALVENTTDQDWKDVRLSLASGRPVSFTMDLYQPLFVTRPDIPVPFLAGVMPRVFESAQNMQSFEVAGREGGRGFYNRLGGADESPTSKMAVAGSAMADSRVEREWYGTEVETQMLTDYAAQAAATAGVAGETFMYTLDAPVTLERQRSAMLPILTAPIEGRRISIYNLEALAKHPMRGVQFKNTSGLHLMPGPISVMDGAAYAGDSQIPHTSRGNERILSYAVDLDVIASHEFKNESNLVRVKIVDGVLQFESKARQTWDYKFTNNDAEKARALIVEHPKQPGWELVTPEKPAEITEHLYRFDLPLEADKGAALAVVLEQVQRSVIELTRYNLDQLLVHVKDGKASQSVVDAFRKAAAIRSRTIDAERQLVEIKRMRDEIETDQNRIRQNMQTVDRNSELYRRYFAKLNDQETTMENLEEQRQSQTVARDAAEAELNEFLRDLDVE